MKYVIVPTTRNGKAVYFKENIYYQLKPVNPITNIIILRCKFYHYPNFRCKVKIKSYNENVISINRQHKAHQIVTENEVIMMQAKKKIKSNILINKGPIKKTFEETVNDVIANYRIPLKHAAEYAPKYKSVQKTLYKLRHETQIKKISFQVRLNLFLLIG
ncbi:unnamed protein product [Brachionus calyciflorus]|uniref:FLYWCH-type domain-containing protein n=1 Tax=Brachionus calyciflorus TaxID=104777 RepID=A0A814AVS2_9BILA|nr:unnamed protein product [Brachionus calyciflorus]